MKNNRLRFQGLKGPITLDIARVIVGLRGQKIRLDAELNAQFGEPAKLERASKSNLKGVGYGQ